MQFSDSISENAEILRELLRGQPPQARKRAAKAAAALEKTFMQLRRDNPNDPVVGLGVTFALFVMAERLVDDARENPGKGLIQLLS